MSNNQAHSDQNHSTPSAPRRRQTLVAHGDERVDDWYWLAERENPGVVAYLEEENAYADAVLAPLADLRARLFEEIKQRVVETDVSAPSRSGPWWYWNRTVEGLQYGITCRRHDPDRRLSAVEVLAVAQVGGEGIDVVLDENELAAGSDFFALGVFDVSADHRLLAYAVDLDGGELYRLRFRNLEKGIDLPDVIEEVQYGSAWATDSRTFFYVRVDDAMRPYQVWRHHLRDDPGVDELVFEETDERFFVSVELTRSERFILIASESKTSSQYLFVDAGRPDDPPASVLPRRADVEYDLDHAVLPVAGDTWLVRTNAPSPDGVVATNFAVRTLRMGGGWDDLVDLIPHRQAVKVESIMAFSDHVVVAEREAGLERLRVLTLTTGSPSDPVAEDYVIDQPDDVYSLGGGANADFSTDVLRFAYTSLVAPISSIDHHIGDRRREVIKVQPVRGGYRPEDYRTERLWATADDGTLVPISVVTSKDNPRDGSAPCLLYGYGAYEITIDPAFSAARLNLLERGFTFAIAHVRGGGELGREWYDQGKLRRKRSTFTDFIACAEHLLSTGWTRADRLVARGGSAGGLLMGAVTNLRPDLWRAVVAEVPFVDVVTTMSDTSLPLTITEWEEWGNPVDDPEAYRYMLSYSPYDNVAAVDHPAMYVTGGLNDPRVGYWEPAKWVAKMRRLGTGELPVLLRTELGAGHQGPSGRYDAWHDEARVQAFMLWSVGLA